MKSVVMTICVGVLGFVLIGFASADVVILDAALDAWGNEEAATTNYSQWGDVWVRSDADGLPDRTTYLKWNLDPLAGKTITGVKLYVDVNSANPSAWVNVNVHAVTADWSESAVTWNDRTTGVAWTAPGGDYEATRFSALGWNGTAGYKSVIMSGYEAGFISQIQDWVDGTVPNYGLALVMSTYNAGSNLGAIGSTSGDQDPAYLEITYVPEPATIGLLVFGFGLLRRSRRKK